MRGSRSRWQDHETWACLNHLPPISLPAATDTCWMRGCSHRPDDADRPEVVIVEEPVHEHDVYAEGVEVCSLDGCHEVARPRSKYCSRQCSNKNARQRHQKRNKAA